MEGFEVSSLDGDEDGLPVGATEGSLDGCRDG